MTATTTLELNNKTYTLERASARKASRALAILRALSKSSDELQGRLATFRLEYERDHVMELDRAQARLRYPAQVIIDPDTNLPLREPDELETGRPNPNAGEWVTAPSPLDSFTDADWEAAGNVLRIRATPSTMELAVAGLDVALELAEEHVYRLLALFTIPNEDVKKWSRDGSFGEELERVKEDLLDDVYGDELLELAATIGELVDSTFVRKASELGDRLGNVARLLGLSTEGPNPTPASSSAPSDPPPSSDGPETSRPESSTDSAAPTTDGDPATPSTSHGTSSSTSSPDSPERPTTPSPSITAA